jgi:ubiquinone/menaquinone biosynthesis C-methylase UbiE
MELSVQKFYNSNSKRFSQTRYSIWESVKSFNNLINNKSLILDAGCGNGKNMIFLKNNGHNVKGIDFSDNLLKICTDKQLDVTKSDIRNIPYDNDTFDYTISIAVIHHLSTHIDRIKAINELLRVTKKNGRILITVWAIEQEEHSRRTFKLGDNIVPFEDSFRYYHIFNEETFLNLIKEFQIEKYFWEKGNWNAILKVN